MTNITLSIPEIHCVSCEALIKMSLKSLPGIHQSSIDGKTKKVSISYDEKLTSRDNIVQQIQKVTGYKVI